MPRFAPGILDPGDRTTSNVDGGDEGPDRRSRRRGAEHVEVAGTAAPHRIRGVVLTRPSRQPGVLGLKPVFVWDRYRCDHSAPHRPGEGRDCSQAPPVGFDPSERNRANGRPPPPHPAAGRGAHGHGAPRAAQTNRPRSTLDAREKEAVRSEKKRKKRKGLLCRRAPAT